jgi:hypothetical protein
LDSVARLDISLGLLSVNVISAGTSSMSGTGGKRPGAGRKAGGKNRERTVREVAEKARRGGGTPLHYMLKVMNNPKASTERRDMMAVASAPFVHPRLARIASDDTSVERPITKFEVEIVVPKGYAADGGRLIDHAPLDPIGLDDDDRADPEIEDAAEALGDPEVRRAV